ncbi:hypothetical protein FRC98_01320 [Lujinxingia vulgaris]|uniref:Bacterial surface antigen (D15) domain-containing protein n=1 Tax=Lujinxingia vulgaris TaxID=2600176 RepID=A0A5C6XF06_9DELT|nr:hypothetical protein [Lujinxingia vulgaris]TXD39073.1 hypothetical protein FRC98_01320 [Lujinxingia vulgaris]
MMMFNPIHNLPRRAPSPKISPALLALMVLCGLLASASPALAQSADDLRLEDAPAAEDASDDEAQPDDAAESSNNEPGVRPAPTAEDRQQQASESVARQLQTSANTVTLYQLAEEMVDEAISDIADLNPTAVAPVAVRNLDVSPNLSIHFGDFVQSTFISSVANLTDIRIKRCIACRAMRSRVEGDDWVVSLGLTEHEDLRREAERLGVKTYLDLRFHFFPEANVAAMQLEIFRADDGAILWSQTYRSDATSAAILRSGDRVVSRAERVRELERKVEERPYYGHTLYLGMSTIPYDGPAGAITGAAIGYRLYERFGEDRRYLFGVGAEGFANFSDANGLLGAFVGATFQRELLPPNLNSIELRTGPTVGGFFAGSEGNSFAVEWGLDAVLQFRLGAGLSLMYFLPTEYAGYDLGGFGFKARASFNW